MLEKECHSIDLQIADVLAKRREKVAESTKFGSFIISKQNAKQLVKKKARKEHKLATLPQGSEEQQKTKKEIAMIEKKKKTVKVAKTKASFSIRTCHIKPGQSPTETSDLGASLSRSIVCWETLCQVHQQHCDKRALSKCDKHCCQV